MPTDWNNPPSSDARKEVRIMGKRKTKIINVDYQRLEKQGYKSASRTGKEILDAMIKLGQKRDNKPTARERAKRDLVHATIDEVLTERQKQVIELVFGLTGLQPMSEQEIAETLKISRPTVQSAKRRSMEKLKKHMALNQDALKNIKNS